MVMSSTLIDTNLGFVRPGFSSFLFVFIFALYHLVMNDAGLFINSL